jgi:hypothetical protein
MSTIPAPTFPAELVGMNPSASREGPTFPAELVGMNPSASREGPTFPAELEEGDHFFGDEAIAVTF